MSTATFHYYTSEIDPTLTVGISLQPDVKPDASFLAQVFDSTSFIDAGVIRRLDVGNAHHPARFPVWVSKLLPLHQVGLLKAELIRQFQLQGKSRTQMGARSPYLHSVILLDHAVG